MSVIRTDEWLLDSYEKPIEIGKKLEPYFDGTHGSDIYDYLTLHGMYRNPSKNGNELVKKLQENKIWELVQKEKQALRKAWGGPNIPIFIFPSDSNNRKLQRELNGKSGLAFKDKLFLFVSEDNEEKELKALFTHEFNHVCRLSNYHKKEADYVLLDTIILEGLAENAVRERVGADYVAAWSSYYSNRELDKLWNNLILPNKNTPKNTRKHHDILYGLRFYPKMSGYCVGYYLVKKYIEATGLTSKELLITDANTIATSYENTTTKN